MAQEGWVPLGENPRPLTADDYQRGEMAALAAFVGPKLSIPIDALVRAIVNEVLTPPPSRPEGAEDIEAWLDGMPESIRLDGDEHQRLFANHLAHMGFRIPAVMEEER